MRTLLRVSLLAVLLTFGAGTVAFAGETRPTTTVTAEFSAADTKTPATVPATTLTVETPGKAGNVKEIIEAVIAAHDGKPIPETLPGWLKIAIPIVIGLWTLFGLPLIQKLKAGVDAHIAASKSQAAANQIDMSKSLFEQKSALAAQVKAFAEEQVWTMAQQDYPKIARLVLSGHLTESGEIKKLLYQLNEDLQAKVIEYFRAHGVDVIAAFGKTWLEKLIDDAVDKLPAFPGKDTAKELLDGTVAQLVVDYGVGWVKKWYSGELAPAVQDQAGLTETPAKMFAARYRGHGVKKTEKTAE